MKNIIFFTYCCILIGLFNLQLQSQINPTHSRFVLNVDYNRFWQNDSTAYLEISTAFYPSLAILKQDSLGYHGIVQLNVLIKNKSNGTLVKTDRFNIPINLIDSASLAKAGSIVNNSTYTLGYGSYAVTVFCHDVADRSRQDSSSFSVDILKKPGTVTLSDVELCSNITESTNQKDIFCKNTYRVIPNPSCVFGSALSPLVYIYVELYNLDIGMTYEIKVQVADSKGIVKKNRKYLRRFSMPNVVDVTTLNITSINSGKHNFEYIISDTLGHEIVKSQRPIFIYNPNIQSTNASTLSERSSEFAGMTSDELASEFRSAKYVASSDDIQIFDKLSTTEARREFLAKFWTRIENSESGRSDITRMSYLQRVQTADQRYRTYAKEGWRTDRGRVYVLYGEPDETQRFPSSQDNTKPYEIWTYHQMEGGADFVFIDLTGFNEYILVHSTKRGELQDASWEQLLH